VTESLKTLEDQGFTTTHLFLCRDNDAIRKYEEIGRWITSIKEAPGAVEGQ